MTDQAERLFSEWIEREPMALFCSRKATFEAGFKAARATEPRPDIRRVVIESPFGRNVDGSKCTPAEYARNARYLDRCIRDSLSRGEWPYASHGFFPAPGRLDDTIPEQREQGIAAGLGWAEAAGLCAAYLDHGETEGMTRGMARHVDRGIHLDFRRIGAEPEIEPRPELEPSTPQLIETVRDGLLDAKLLSQIGLAPYQAIDAAKAALSELARRLELKP